MSLISYVQDLLHNPSLRTYHWCTCTSFAQCWSKHFIYSSLLSEDYVLSVSPALIWIKPITDETVPISPTNQLGNRPAHRKPGGIQWMALLRSAILLTMERSSPRICVWSREWLNKNKMIIINTHLSGHIVKEKVSGSRRGPSYFNCKELNICCKTAETTPVASSVSPTSLQLPLQQQQNSNWPEKQGIHTQTESVVCPIFSN